MLAPSAAFAADLPDWLKWLEKEVFDRVSVTGSRRLSYHNHRVTGDEEAFSQGTNFGLGGETFTDVGNIRVSGNNVLGSLNFDFNIQDSRFDQPQEERLSLNYKRGPFTVDLGDIQGTLLNTNAFARFSRTLRGAGFGYTAGRFRFRALTSEARGEATTVSIQGLNTAGPYYLQASQIVHGSEQVQVDGVPQQLGVDYVIDYDIGAITFVNRQTLEAKIIPPTSSIVVTYESFGFSGSKGRVEGAALSYDFGRVGRLGLTGMWQRQGGSAGFSSRLEKFQGYGAASTPYFLQFEPLRTQPVTIRVDGVLQVEGVDFRFDAENPSIFYFNRFMPATSNIDVLYTPKPRSTVDGDRQTVGVDWRVPLGKRDANYIQYSHAVGETTNTTTPRKGTARGVELRYDTGGLSLQADVRDVPEDFVTVETTGFSRNEKSAKLGLRYRQNARQSYGADWSNSSITTRTSDDSFATRFTVGRLWHDYSLPGWGQPVRTSYARTLTRNASVDSRIDTAELNAGRSFGKLDTRLGFRRQDASGRTTSDGERRQASLNSLTLGGSYDAGRSWRIGFDTSLSQVQSDGESDWGRDLNLTLRYTPTSRLSAFANYTDSDGGEAATLAQFGSGWGIGYGGNGFSGSPSTGTTTSSSSARVIRAGVDLQPSDRISARGVVALSRTEGGFSSNAETLTVGLGGDWDLGSGNFLGGSLDFADTKFLDQDLRSTSTILNGWLEGSPQGPWSYRLGGSYLVSGGASEFSQDNLSLDASLSYRIDARQLLSLSAFKGNVRGYLPQDNFEASLIYRYRIMRGLAVDFAYRFRDVENLDDQVTSGAYRSQGFDVSLALDFGL